MKGGGGGVNAKEIVWNLDWKLKTVRASAFLLCAEVICLSLFTITCTDTTQIHYNLHFNGSHESRKTLILTLVPPVRPFSHLIMPYDFRFVCLAIFFYFSCVCPQKCGRSQRIARWCVERAMDYNCVFTFLWTTIGGSMHVKCDGKNPRLIKDTTSLWSLINVYRLIAIIYNYAIDIFYCHDSNECEFIHSLIFMCSLRRITGRCFLFRFLWHRPCCVIQLIFTRTEPFQVQKWKNYTADWIN